MDNLKILLEKKQFKKIKEDSTWYKELGKEMTDYFGKNCYWLPFKYPQYKLREKFKAIQGLENKEFKYFLGMLNKN
jgi:hypothetical protein